MALLSPTTFNGSESLQAKASKVGWAASALHEAAEDDVFAPGFTYAFLQPFEAAAFFTDGRGTSSLPRRLSVPPPFDRMRGMERQYWEIKSQYFDCILFFKKGKFYELYEMDAVVAHRWFGLRLTCDTTNRGEMRMAGVPEVRLQDWARLFLFRGYKVAVVEQLQRASAGLEDSFSVGAENDAPTLEESDAAAPSTTSLNSLAPTKTPFSVGSPRTQRSVGKTDVSGTGIIERVLGRVWTRGSMTEGGEMAASGASQVILAVCPTLAEPPSTEASKSFGGKRRADSTAVSMCAVDLSRRCFFICPASIDDAKRASSTETAEKEPLSQRGVVNEALEALSALLLHLNPCEVVLPHPTASPMSFVGAGARVSPHFSVSAKDSRAASSTATVFGKETAEGVSHTIATLRHFLEVEPEARETVVELMDEDDVRVASGASDDTLSCFPPSISFLARPAIRLLYTYLTYLRHPIADALAEEPWRLFVAHLPMASSGALQEEVADGSPYRSEEDGAKGCVESCLRENVMQTFSATCSSRRSGASNVFGSWSALRDSVDRVFHDDAGLLLPQATILSLHLVPCASFSSVHSSEALASSSGSVGEAVSTQKDDGANVVAGCTIAGSILELLLPHCCTAAGKRLLRSWLLRPLQTTAAISLRQQTVRFLANLQASLRVFENLVGSTGTRSREGGSGTAAAQPPRCGKAKRESTVQLSKGASDASVAPSDQMCRKRARASPTSLPTEEGTTPQRGESMEAEPRVSFPTLAWSGVAMDAERTMAVLAELRLEPRHFVSMADPELTTRRQLESLLRVVDATAALGFIGLNFLSLHRAEGKREASRCNDSAGTPYRNGGGAQSDVRQHRTFDAPLYLRRLLFSLLHAHSLRVRFGEIFDVEHARSSGDIRLLQTTTAGDVGGGDDKDATQAKNRENALSLLRVLRCAGNDADAVETALTRHSLDSLDVALELIRADVEEEQFGHRCVVRYVDFGKERYLMEVPIRDATMRSDPPSAKAKRKGSALLSKSSTTWPLVEYARTATAIRYRVHALQPLLLRRQQLRVQWHRAAQARIRRVATEMSASISELFDALRALAALDACCALAAFSHTPRFSFPALLDLKGSEEDATQPFSDSSTPREANDVGSMSDQNVGLRGQTAPAASSTGNSPSIGHSKEHSASALSEARVFPRSVIRATGLFHPLLASPIPNDVSLDEGRVVILTGPNMGGKSTLMRGIAIGCVLAQLGTAVPAQTFSLSPLKQLWTRLGARDDPLRGHSTLMVELEEVKRMLRYFDGQTLCLVDELGRGTATHDGCAIAGAVLRGFVEGIPDRRGATAENAASPLILYSTHFHTLALQRWPSPLVQRWFMDFVRVEGTEEVQFLYRRCDGVCGRSYGVEVASRAGISDAVLQRAKERSRAMALASLVGRLRQALRRENENGRVETHGAEETPL